MKHRRPLASLVKPMKLLALASLPLALGACAGPPMTSPIDGEPVCPDIEVGAARTKMTGGLRFPVHLEIKSGSAVVFKTTIVGLRTEKDLASRVLLADDDETYSLEWGQCENERAPTPVDSKGRDTKGAAKYECGKSAVYKTDQLTTKKGDPKSHAITFAAPPNPACLSSTAPSPAAADAGAPAASASAEANDAGVEPTDAGAGDDAASPSAADAGDAGKEDDAGAADSGASDAGRGDDAGKGAAKAN